MSTPIESTRKVIAVIIFAGLLVATVYCWRQNAKLQAEEERLNYLLDSSINDNKNFRKAIDVKSEQILALENEVAENNRTILRLHSDAESLRREKIRLTQLVDSFRDSLAATGDERYRQLVDEYSIRVDSLESENLALRTIRYNLERAIDSLRNEQQKSLAAQTVLYIMMDSLEKESRRKDSLIYTINLQSDSIYTIIDDTELTIRNIEGYQELRGNDRVRNVSRGWKKTVFNLHLSNPRIKLHDGMAFGVRIRDLDNKKMLVNREGEKINYLVRFTPSTAHEIIHVNYEEKEGENYDAQIIFLVGDIELPLANGVIPLIRNNRFEKW